MCERHVFRILCLAACASIAGCMTSSDKCGSDQEVYCFDRCIDPLSNPSYCGLDSTCTTYETCKEGQLCNDGKCVAATCGEGKVVCANECVDPKTNLVYCGANAACDQYETCPAETMCIDGVCKVPAPDCPVPGDVFCGGLCINPKTNNTFCGITAACMDYRTCKPGATCVDGKCTEPCAGKEILCGGICIDPKTNNAFCGISNDCNGFEVCGNGTQCVDGKCVDANTCASDEVLCGGMCIDPKTNNTFCGIDEQCGNYQTCATGEECVDGRCKATKECAPGQILCGGVCIDPKTNNSFCGIDAQCSGFATCSPSEACVDGKCKPFLPTANDCDAEAGEIKCGNVCINPKTDPLYCGIAADCTGYSRCADGAACVDGVCTAKQTCLETEKLCGGICIDPKTNDVFCGMKDDCKTYTSCPAGASCVDGACATCQSDEVLCGGFCIDPDTNSTFCGMSEDCSSYKTCTQNESCVDGECVANKTCQTGEILLGSVCIDPKTNNAFCGMKPDFSSYTNCKPGQYCDDGVCKNYSVCTEGMVSCGGRCINPNRDEKYCGADATCQNYEVCGEGQKCRQGVCKTVQSCEPGDVFCTDTNTCIDPKFDDAHCGADRLCESFTACKAGERCESGRCQPNPQCGEVAATTEGGTPTPIFCEIGQFCHVTTTTATPPVTTKTCKPSIKACSGRTVDIRNDVSNCGDCNVKCGDNQVCTDGVCVAVTPTNQEVEVYCGGILTKLGTRNNCSKCGDMCSSIQTCTDMVCVDDPDYKLCGNQKTHIKKDPANCGDCGVKCNESTQSCEDGTCTDIPGIVSCNEGTTKDPKNVYRNTNLDSLNCGGCGKKCGIEAPVCVKGKCMPVPTSDGQLVCRHPDDKQVDIYWWTDGDCHFVFNPESGEDERICNSLTVKWSSERENCGACGNDCGEGNDCNEGVCKQTCTRTEGDKTITTHNVDIMNDSMHCGACNSTCPKGSTCKQGVCKAGNSDRLTCDTKDIHHAYWDISHCGSCNNKCAADTTCIQGICGTTCGDYTNIHLSNDSANCNSCGNKCPANQVCYNGRCIENTSWKRDLVCNGIMIDEQGRNDSSNCGGCGIVCPADKPKCDEGVCRAWNKDEKDRNLICSYKRSNRYDNVEQYDNNDFISVQKPRYDSVSVDTNEDSANCGSCGNLCAIHNRCVFGNCIEDQQNGWTNCNGKENHVDLKTDRNNCGQCGRAVGDGKVCENGDPAEMTEDNSMQQCDVTITNEWGEETHRTSVKLWNATDHCGDCNFKCGNGKYCVAGKCEDLPDNYGTEVTQYCVSNDPWRYDEYNLSIGNIVGKENSKQNCGYCGKMCKNATCKEGKCGETCDGIEEIDTQKDSYYCGGCGSAAVPKTCDKMKACVNGECQDEQGGGVLANATCKGVEGINLLKDSANCGQCGNKLKKAVPNEDGKRMLYYVCVGGNEVSDQGSTTYCNKDYTDLKDDSLNCGQCGNVCKHGTTCNEGKCEPFELKVPKDTKKQFVYSFCGYKGKEKPNVALPQIDANNCGMCGKKCGVGEYCKDGSCTTIDDKTHAVSYCGTKVPKDVIKFSGWLTNVQTITKYWNAISYRDEKHGFIYEVVKYTPYMFNDIVKGYNNQYFTGYNSTTNINTNYTYFPTLAFDKNNCGQCGNKCENEKESCIYGKCLELNYWN